MIAQFDLTEMRERLAAEEEARELERQLRELATLVRRTERVALPVLVGPAAVVITLCLIAQIAKWIAS